MAWALNVAWPRQSHGEVIIIAHAIGHAAVTIAAAAAADTIAAGDTIAAAAAAAAAAATIHSCAWRIMIMHNHHA